MLRGWKLHQFDGVTAFLHGDIDSSIYVELLEGLKRTRVRGLKQAPRIWYQCVHRVPVSHGFTMAQSDHCVWRTTAADFFMLDFTFPDLLPLRIQKLPREAVIVTIAELEVRIIDFDSGRREILF